MPHLNFEVDEERLLRAYKISSLNPKKWEEVDHEFEESIGASLLEPSMLVEKEGPTDPLGLPHSVDIKELNVETRAAVLITSKQFDPAAYLSIVHPNATYHDLVTGIVNLQNAIEARAEAVRILVEDNFDKFASVKATIEGLHGDMGSGILASESDYGSKPLRDHLKEGGQKANQIFLPVLESASKAQKLRATLTIFERSRFFFNLPTFIMESIDLGRFDLAIRDYKKGKYILENRPGQLLPIGPMKDGGVSLSEQQRQKQILNKVWAIVEKAMANMKRVLVTQLEDLNRSVDEHEKSLEILMDFQSNDEPLWTYLENQNRHTINRMTSEHENAVKKIEATLRNIRGSNLLRQQELQTAVLQLRAKQTDDAILAESVTEPGWQAVLDLVKIVSESISSSLHNFWAISKSLMDGKLKRPPISTRSPSQCQTMALSIVRHYISLISQTFMLSDVITLTSPSSNSANCWPPLLPVIPHSLSTAYHLQKILAEVQDCVNDISSLDISADVNQGLKNLLESVQWKFLDVLARDWLKDANIFYHLESWTVEPEEPTATSFPLLFEHFQRHLTISAYKIAVAAESTFSPAPFTTRDLQNLPISRNKSRIMPSVFMDKLTKTFKDSIYAFLDGLVLLTTDESPNMKEPDEVEHVRRTTHKMGLQDVLDLRDADVRKLLVLSNIKYLNGLFPDMITQLESGCGIKLSEDRKMLKSVIEGLDETLFNEYSKPKSSVVARKVREGILSNFDWYNAPQPTGVRSYAYDIMNYLVELHAQVCTVSEGLLERTLNAVLEELVDEVAKCFNQIKEFGTGGLLTAVMELTFIQKSLGYYGRETAAGKILEDLCTQQITNAYSPSAVDENFNLSFQAMQKTLSDARRATAVQFLCFRLNTSKSADLKGGDGNSKRMNQKEKEGGRKA